MKLLASDFDGTLFQKFKVSRKDRKAIKKFQEKHQFMMATGRNVQIIEDACTKNHIQTDMMIALNGAWIQTPEFTTKKTIESSLVDQVYELLKKEVAHFSTFDERCRYTAFSHQGKKITFILWFIRLFLLKENVENKYYHKNVFMIEVVGYDIENTKRARMLIEQNFPNIFEISGNSMYFDLTIKTANKCEALKIIEEYYQMNHDNMYCIGDSENDYEMLSKFNGFGIRKHQGIEKYAKVLVNHVSEAIEILLNKE